MGDGSFLYETIDKPAGSGVSNAEGIWHQLYEDFDTHAAWTGPLPTSVTERTVSMCHNHDTVCAPGFLTFAAKAWPMGTTAHTSDTPEELNWLGAQAAVFTAARLAPE